MYLLTHLPSGGFLFAVHFSCKASRIWSRTAPRHQPPPSRPFSSSRTRRSAVSPAPLVNRRFKISSIIASDAMKNFGFCSAVLIIRFGSRQCRRSAFSVENQRPLFKVESNNHVEKSAPIILIATTKIVIDQVFIVAYLFSSEILPSRNNTKKAEAAQLTKPIQIINSAFTVFSSAVCPFAVLQSFSNRFPRIKYVSGGKQSIEYYRADSRNCRCYTRRRIKDKTNQRQKGK